MEVVEGQDTIRETQLTHLVDAYQTALLRMCYIQLRDRALAEDAVQETYLKAYKSLASFRGECSERSWLMRIAINTCRDMQRTGWFRHMDRRVTPELVIDEAVTPREDDGRLALAMMTLPQRLREVLILYYYQGMTAAEVGSALKISKVTVSRRLQQAKDKLRGALNGGDLRD